MPACFNAYWFKVNDRITISNKLIISPNPTHPAPPSPYEHMAMLQYLFVQQKYWTTSNFMIYELVGILIGGYLVTHNSYQLSHPAPCLSVIYTFPSDSLICNGFLRKKYAHNQKIWAKVDKRYHNSKFISEMKKKN